MSEFKEKFTEAAKAFYDAMGPNCMVFIVARNAPELSVATNVTLQSTAHLAHCGLKEIQQQEVRAN